MQYIQTSDDSYLEFVIDHLANIYEERGLNFDLETANFGEFSSEGQFSALVGVSDIHKLDKKEILNYSVAIFGLLTDIKDNGNKEVMGRSLTAAFEFIEGYTADKGTQIKMFTVLYNIFQLNERYRHDVFIRLLSFWEANDCIFIIKNNLLIIDQISKIWEISNEERIALYNQVITHLIEEDKLIAYELMLKALILLGDNKDQITKNKDLIIRTSKLALEHPKITQFEYLYNTPAIKALKEEKIEEKLEELLHIFTYDTLDEYNKWESTNKKYLDDSSLDAQVLKNKIMYLSFCSLAMNDNVITFDKLAEIVDIKRDEIEEWVVDAVVNDIIDARIDQDNEQVIINTFTQRTTNLKDRINKTTSDFDSVLSKIREQ